MKERIVELVNTIGMSLDAPYYATNQADGYSQILRLCAAINTEYSEE